MNPISKSPEELLWFVLTAALSGFVVGDASHNSSYGIATFLILNSLVLGMIVALQTSTPLDNPEAKSVSQPDKGEKP